MTIANTKKKTKRAAGKTTGDVLSKYGITRVSKDYFYYGEYRDTDQKDAIAQAKRDNVGGSQ